MAKKRREWTKQDVRELKTRSLPTTVTALVAGFEFRSGRI